MHARDKGVLDLLASRVQYNVPPWQRRYCWSEREIAKLVDDIVQAGQRADGAHYGGTIITSQCVSDGGIPTVQVVDGQQRLTTVSLLLAVCAFRLGEDDEHQGLTRAAIRDTYLRNRTETVDRTRKLHLQEGDEQEFTQALHGRVDGPGSIAQAWTSCDRLVRRTGDGGVGDVLNGLARLAVVHIRLDGEDDAQQIFESLNGTGRPLAESEKVKNWLLMTGDAETQEHLHSAYWLPMEEMLDARYEVGNLDEFLRDVLRWKTGQVPTIRNVYENFRRYVDKTRRCDDREALCADLRTWTGHYARIVGAQGARHPDHRVEHQLSHLRALGMGAYGPFALRVLDDEDRVGPKEAAETLETAASWITRMWLADKSMSGLNREMATIASEILPDETTSYAQWWKAKIARLAHTGIGVPDDEAVSEGIRTRAAYGAKASNGGHAVLYALETQESAQGLPAREDFDLEHVMPQKLTREWKETLGSNAKEISERYGNRLANLTLLEKDRNTSVGNRGFAEKRSTYRNSRAELTRAIADEPSWDEEAIERRAESLIERALSVWPWTLAAAGATASGVRWRLDREQTRTSRSAAALVVDVANALLDESAGNGEKLLGSSATYDLQRVHERPGGRNGARMQTIGAHRQYVVYPYGPREKNVDRVVDWARRCGHTLLVEPKNGEGSESYTRFWTRVEEVSGGMPGGPKRYDTNAKATLILGPFGEHGDRIVIYAGNPEELWFYAKAGKDDETAQRTRMRKASMRMLEDMGDLLPQGKATAARKELEAEAEAGRSLSVARPWRRDDEDCWDETTRWIKDGCKRLAGILEQDRTDARGHG